MATSSSSDGHSGQRRPSAGATDASEFTKDASSSSSGTDWLAPEFRTPHALAFDARGRLFVADRGNLDSDLQSGGEFIASYAQFSRVSGLFITPRHASMRSIRKPTR